MDWYDGYTYLDGQDCVIIYDPQFRSVAEWRDSDTMPSEAELDAQLLAAGTANAGLPAARRAAG